MADGYDAHLVQNLNYRAPNLLIETLSAMLPPASAALVILDAGCGTGLCGPLLRSYAKRLVGVDLSAAMLDRAAGTDAYDNLVNAELTEYLTGQKEAFDVIVSADTLCYFGALEPVLRAAAGALKPGGLLAFTLEDAGETATGWQLNFHGRYAHPRAYVETALAAAGLSLRSISPAVLRTEGRNAVAGHLVAAGKDKEEPVPSQK
jgi:predicted TPR repeat methyltransferase